MKMGENQVDFLGTALIFDVSVDNRNRRYVFKYMLRTKSSRVEPRVARVCAEVTAASRVCSLAFT